jgi:hypothetical protein
VAGGGRGAAAGGRPAVTPAAWLRPIRARLGQTLAVRSYRFYGLTSEGATELTTALNEDGMRAEPLPPGRHELPGWVVVATGEDRSEGLLEMLAQLYGGSYEGEDLAGA